MRPPAGGEPFLSLLEQDYDVLAFDHRGIGESDRADEPFTVANCTYAGPDGGSVQAPGPLRMVEAMNTGDVATILRTGYEANLSPTFRADESRVASRVIRRTGG